MKYTIICLLTIAQITYGQNACEENSNSKIAADLVYSEKDHPNDYNIIRSSWIAFEDPSYLAPVPLVIPYKPRRIELREFEKSISSFQLMEAKLNLKYTIASGRESSKGMLRRVRGTINYAPNFRMYMNGNASNPLTPTNQDIGIGVDMNIFANNLGYIWNDRNRQLLTEGSLKTMNFWNFNISAAHYSNGQENGFFYQVNNDKRNDYQKGDFSTNYLRFTLVYGQHIVKDRQKGATNDQMWQIGLGYQNDGKAVGGFTHEQIRSYGKSRLSFKLDYRFGPKKTFCIFHNGPGFSKRVIVNNETVMVNKTVEHHLYFKTSVIIDNLDNFTPNIKNDSGKYRLNFEVFYELNYYRWRTLSLFAKYYFGRDYINIKYDDIVHVVMIGLVANFNKYRAPLWKPCYTLP
ncbi:MAG: hypothetical protein U0V49_10780 [Saprospiraceae bacterium]